MVEMLALRMWLRRYPLPDAYQAMLCRIPDRSRQPDPRWDVSRDGSGTPLDALMILQAVAEGTEVS
ncbi:MAG: hypothetical protein C4B59_12630 [Candidatus Methanogaster sp.]|uniref:Uncharacterized protein n=1 Tax=Candidatus Methanogaster sp. TaxID=3386292 RepID=A0AC61L0L6_9EURY|nr:MAG: hypothetical protein C4B59_12630 [ANME-2 cluster archaeon]